MSALATLWLPTQEVYPLLGHSSVRPLRRDLKNGKYSSRMVDTAFGARYEVDLFSLPAEIQTKYIKAHPDLAALRPELPAEDLEVEMELYAKSPDWSRKKADKYLVVLRSCEGLKGDNLKAWIEDWNSKHPDMATSYPRIMAARKGYQDKGVSALLAEYGKGGGTSSVRDDWFEFFKSRYLKEGGPSLPSCWMLTMGKAFTEDPGLSEDNFPSQWAFKRRLDTEVPEDAIYRAREGHSRWYRKYAGYIPRDYTDIETGSVWVSDHAQVDVMVLLPNGKPCIPWVTAWRDFKSSKWMGWNIHPEAPNSDHIFQAFHTAAVVHGLPEKFILDNGKDYRCKDFAGGRKVHRVEDVGPKARSLVGALNIGIHYAQPYNAQTKPIERDFLKNKTWFSMHMPGYRGGNVVERPEILEDEIKAGRLMTLAEFEILFNRYVEEVLMRMPSKGKVLQGECPAAYFAKHCKTLRRVSADALMLFCTRVTGDHSVGRNGVYDSKYKVTYWAEWMAVMKGKKVFMRRNDKAVNEAWIFLESTGEFLGKAGLVESASALAETPREKQQLRDMIAHKRREEKMVKALADGGSRATPAESIQYMAAGAAALSGPLPAAQPKRERIDLTVMDSVLAEERRREASGSHPLGQGAKDKKSKKPLYTFAFERLEAEERERRKAGT